MVVDRLQFGNLLMYNEYTQRRAHIVMYLMFIVESSDFKNEKSTFIGRS